MLNKNDLTKLAKRILHPHKGLHSPQIMHPTREWFTGLAVAAGIFMSSIAWSAYTYVSHQSVSIDAESVIADQPVVYRESMVQSALQIFADKEQLIPEIITEEPVPLEVPPTAGTSTPEVENLEVSQSTSTAEEIEAESDESTSSTTEPVTPEPAGDTSSENSLQVSG